MAPRPTSTYRSVDPAPELLVHGPAFLVNQRSRSQLAIAGRALLVLVIWATLLGPPWALLRWYASWCGDVPGAPDLLEHRGGSGQTEFLASDGVRLGAAGEVAQPWLSMDEIPLVVVQAFVAAEDQHFFEHDGIDWLGVLRAVRANLLERRVAQGGSGITQQLAKMYVGRQRTLDRKLREALLARRIEAQYSKFAILEAYLNRIYLGAGAHGVAAAAARYYGRPLAELSVSEVALIAGLTSAPSRLNPYHNAAGALVRRSYVLDRMAALGFIDASTHEAARLAPIGLVGDRPDDRLAPYLIDEAMRQMRALPPERRRGASPTDQAWHTDTRRDLVVETTASLPLQLTAVEAVRAGAEQVARHRFNRAALGRLALREHTAFIHDALATYGDTRVAGTTYLGVVTSVGSDTLVVDTGVPIVVDRDGLRWARLPPEDEGAHPPKHAKKPRPRPMEQVARVGELVQVRARQDGAPTMPVFGELVPAYDVQGALASFEVDSGGVRALVGGTGYDVTQFQRATRGCRQPGSAFKPLLYAAALERGFTPASLVVDLPVRYEDPSGNLVWEPRNADRDFKGALLLASALARSRNLPAVKLIHQVGIDAVADFAQRLGIHSPLRRTPSLALGASCVTPLELTSAYGTFANGGWRTDPYLVRTISTREGELVYDHGAFFATSGPLDARLYRLVGALSQPREQVLDDAVAHMTAYMLRQVVQSGTGKDAKSLEVPVAGKTGTTNRFDVWFVGFSEDVVTGVWLGDDLNRADLGDGESGGTSALPVWTAYMRTALADRPQEDPLSERPASVEYQRIDPETGLLAHPKGHGFWMPFVRGTAPTQVAAGPTHQAAAAADVLDRDF